MATRKDHTMTKQTLTALRKSIKHWERMRDDPECNEIPGPDDCALCQLFYDDWCNGCPVYVATGTRSCDTTPFRRASEVWWHRKRDTTGKTDWQAAANEMIAYLRGLLPQGGGDEDKTETPQEA